VLALKYADPAYFSAWLRPTAALGSCGEKLLKAHGHVVGHMADEEAAQHESLLLACYWKYGWNLHPLTGADQDRWSNWGNDNWGLT
jgi:hypothetical protein